MKYTNGEDMWKDYMNRYGEVIARNACNQYIKAELKAKHNNRAAMEFCLQLHDAMEETDKELTGKLVEEIKSVYSGADALYEDALLYRYSSYELQRLYRNQAIQGCGSIQGRKLVTICA